MKRYMIAAGIGSLVFAAAVGSASVLDINPGVAQTGQETLGGDVNGVKVASYKAESDTGKSSGVKVTKINGVPQGSELFAVVFNGGTKVAEAKTAYTGGNEASFTWKNGPVDIADIESIRLTFESGD